MIESDIGSPYYLQVNLSLVIIHGITYLVLILEIFKRG